MKREARRARARESGLPDAPREALVENRYTVEYLNDIYSCPDCRDTGVLNGGVCHCLDKLYNRELTKELGVLMQNGDECFESFDLNLYSDRLDPRRAGYPARRDAHSARRRT